MDHRDPEWETASGRALHERVDGRQHDQRGHGGEEQTADDRAAQRRGLRRARPCPAPSGSCRRSSRRPSSGSRAAGRAPPSSARLATGRAVAPRALSANVTSRIAFATEIPIAMIAPMNDCTFSVVPVSSSIRSTPQMHRRHRQRSRPSPAGTTENSPPATGRSRPPTAAVRSAGRTSVSSNAGTWPRMNTLTPRGGAPGARDRLPDLARRPRPAACRECSP